MSRTSAPDIRDRATTADPARRWTIADALETYAIPHWGKGYFGVNAQGHLTVHPTKNPDHAIDLKQLIDDLKVRGFEPPVLIRFSDILKHRLGEIAGAFARAIQENRYQGGYSCVYPIKVNQQRDVVEEVRRFGLEHGFGLEAGSKPELLAVLALVDDEQTPIICNGFKDDEFIELCVLAQKIGKRVIPVVERFSELGLIAKYARQHGVRPQMGLRVKLAARGSGKWETSGGARSKFGLFISEVLRGLEFLESEGLADCLKLLHFHLGSQITNIRNVKEAVNELVRVYVQLKQRGAGLEYIDVGGGLGVDYDGSQTAYESSINYTLEEYASDVVYRIKGACDESGVPHPTIITESGRAMVAHHSALIFDVMGVAGYDAFTLPETLPAPSEGADQPQPLVDLSQTFYHLTRKNLVESLHDVISAYDQSLSLFNLGHLSLEQRSYAERMYWATLSKIERMSRRMEHVPEEVENVRTLLSDLYYVNVSIFQSLPDSWAIDQLFPMAPIHRLDEPPTRFGTFADISCDSDGKIDKFIGLREDKPALELHPYDGRPYHIGAFLIGAYQEILGDLHNLFGDTHVVHVTLDEQGHVHIDRVVPGDTVREVLDYVDFSGRELAERMRRAAELAVKQNRITLSESARLIRYYEASLDGYTYLEEVGEE